MKTKVPQASGRSFLLQVSRREPVSFSFAEMANARIFFSGREEKERSGRLKNYAIVKYPRIVSIT
ncbi:hypothetical protein DPQ22_03270 [Candidatus Tokpelaia sp.]|nr:hypothetical protein DPQ22_03270 [Candidatus Tokpelaia sp.]